MEERRPASVSSEDSKGDEPDSRSRSPSSSSNPGVRRSKRVRSTPDWYRSVDFRRTRPRSVNVLPRPIINPASTNSPSSSGTSELSSTTSGSSDPATSTPWLLFAWGFGEVDVDALRRQLARYGSVQYIRVYHNSRENDNKADIFFKTKRGAMSALRAIRLGKLYTSFGITYASLGERNPRPVRMRASNDPTA